MTVSTFLAGVCLTLTLPLTISCGGSPKACEVAAAPGLNISPATATVNHAAASPGNTQTFQSLTGACSAVLTAAQATANWTASDPSVQLSASPNTRVTATCTVALANAV